MAIVKANGNQLIGCTFQQIPFVFYNVISGNGGNGLRITNSNDTTVQANFLGVGAEQRHGRGQSAATGCWSRAPPRTRRSAA